MRLLTPDRAFFEDDQSGVPMSFVPQPEGWEMPPCL
jgi:hypothetical protein